jgi:hypothetical protein
MAEASRPPEALRSDDIGWRVLPMRGASIKVLRHDKETGADPEILRAVGRDGVGAKSRGDLAGPSSLELRPPRTEGRIVAEREADRVGERDPHDRRLAVRRRDTRPNRQASNHQNEASQGFAWPISLVDTARAGGHGIRGGRPAQQTGSGEPWA